jgi:protein-disulfide isomerase
MTRKPDHPTTELMMRPLLCSLAALALLGTVSAAHAQTAAPATPPTAAQAQAFTGDQRKAIEALIREVLLKNPEIIQDALIELEKRTTTAQAEAQKQALAAETAAIMDPARSAIAGNLKGDVTIVEFFDYNCGYCKRSLEDMRVMMKDDPKLRVVMKDFPVLGPESLEASRVAVAVKNQLKADKYWDFHARLMSTKGRVNGEKALEVAKESGVDITRLRKDMESPEIKATLDETVALGDRLGLTGTPAFIVADEIVFGAVGVEALKAKVAAVRQCGKAAC